MTQKEKEEMARKAFDCGWYLYPFEDIIITDPENSGTPLVNNLGGSITEKTRCESHDTVKPDAAIRRRIILEILTGRGELTAREIAAEFHRRGITPTDERNFAAPRLTELKVAGLIEVTGKKKCDSTGRNVALWAVKKEV